MSNNKYNINIKDSRNFQIGDDNIQINQSAEQSEIIHAINEVIKELKEANRTNAEMIEKLEGIDQQINGEPSARSNKVKDFIAELTKDGAKEITKESIKALLNSIMLIAS